MASTAELAMTDFNYEMDLPESEDLPKDTIIDLSQPGIIHYIYPTGREPGLIDPNIGGFLGGQKQ
jgi:hypothetical protein